MRKKIILTGKYCFLAGLLAIPSVGLSAQPPLSSIMSQKDKTPMILCNATSRLIVKTIHENNKAQDYTINVRYPQIVGAHLESSALHFNQGIRLIVYKQIEAFKNKVKNIANDKTLPQATNYLKINYEKADTCSQSQHAEYASVRFGIETYVRGDAHPESEIQSFNYDLGHDKVLTLSDLFKPNSNYLRVIADYCMQQLHARKLPGDFIKTGANAKSDNYQVWSNNVENNLVITFNEAQVAPRYYGSQEVIIPHDVIKNILTHQAACTLSVINCDET